MGLKERAEISIGGPDGGSTWGDEGDSFTLQAHASITVTTSTPGALPAQTITTPNKQMPGGTTNYDYVVPGASIQTLNGLQLSNGPTAQAAAAALSLYFRVCRNLGLGVALAASTQITSLTTAVPLLAPMASGTSIFLQNPSGNQQTVVTSSAVPAGSTVIPITAVTPANAYPVGTAGQVSGTSAIIVVGGLGTNAGPGGSQVPAAGDGAFGWYATALFSGNTGTPAIAPNTTLLTPALATNVALVTPPGTSLAYLPVAPSDNLQAFALTTTSTATVQILNCQPLLT